MPKILRFGQKNFLAEQFRFVRYFAKFWCLANILIWSKIFHFCPTKIWLCLKFWFLVKISVLVSKIDIRLNVQFIATILIFTENFRYLRKISIFGQIFRCLANFFKKFAFSGCASPWPHTPYFWQNFDRKKSIFGQNFYRKKSILGQNFDRTKFDFWPKFLSQKIDFLPKFRSQKNPFLAKISIAKKSIFGQNLNRKKSTFGQDFEFFGEN